MMKGSAEIYLSHGSAGVSNMILREKNIVVDKGLAAGERGVPANEPGNNPPAWPAEGFVE